MPIFDEHQVPPEPVPADDPIPDQGPAPDKDPVPDHNPVAPHKRTPDASPGKKQGLVNQISDRETSFTLHRSISVHIREASASCRAPQ